MAVVFSTPFIQNSNRVLDRPLAGTIARVDPLVVFGPRSRGRADRMFRAIYLETIDGNVRLKELIERIADLDRKVDEKMIFEDTAQGWLPAAA